MSKNIVRTKDFLASYLEHFCYEVSGLVVAYNRLAGPDKTAAYNLMGNQGEVNDGLDLMTLHFRNLHEFFCEPISADYIRAMHYVPDFQGTPARKELVVKENNQVSHLTAHRHTIAQSVKKPWDPNEVMKWFLSNYEKWSDLVPDEYKNNLRSWMNPVNDWMDWYQGEVKAGRV